VPLPETTRAPQRTDTRCARLVERVQLGEPLSADDQAFFDQNCRRR
jgi:ribosome assembly protein YihI (activator of Der GTPase)